MRRSSPRTRVAGVAGHRRRSSESRGPDRAARSRAPAHRSRRRRCARCGSPASSSIVAVMRCCNGCSGSRYAASVGQPLHRTGHQHPAVLAAAVHLQRRRAAAGAQHGLGGTPSSSGRSAVLASDRSSSPAVARIRRTAARCAGVPSWLAHTSASSSRRQAQPGTHHRRRLHRLVRRPRVDRRRRIADRRTRPSRPSRARRPRRSAPTRRSRCACDGDRRERLRGCHRGCRSRPFAVATDVTVFAGHQCW